MPCSSSQQQCPTWESKLQPRSYKSSSLHNPASPCRRDFRKEREGPCYSLPPFFIALSCDIKEPKLFFLRSYPETPALPLPTEDVIIDLFD
uniref:Uncharacterized protein n=1 Tax=Anguilla anguilla TaxID=7936 RepID=A0A0E9S974_ANGAN